MGKKKSRKAKGSGRQPAKGGGPAKGGASAKGGGSAKDSGAQPARGGGSAAKGSGRQSAKGGRSAKIPRRPVAKKQAPAALLIGGIVAVLVGGVVLLSVLTSGNESGTTEATAWDLPTLSDAGDNDDDGRLTLAEYRGTPVVLNFFASWCTSCEAELPRFDAAANIAAGDVEFVFINSNETGNWRPMAERTGVDDRVLVKDINGGASNGLYRSLGGSGGMPMTAFYDADGAVLQVDRGELSYQALANRLATLYGVDIQS